MQSSLSNSECFLLPVCEWNASRVFRAQEGIWFLNSSVVTSWITVGAPTNLNPLCSKPIGFAFLLCKSNGLNVRCLCYLCSASQSSFVLLCMSLFIHLALGSGKWSPRQYLTSDTIVCFDDDPYSKIIYVQESFWSKPLESLGTFLKSSSQVTQEAHGSRHGHHAFSVEESWSYKKTKRWGWIVEDCAGWKQPHKPQDTMGLRAFYQQWPGLQWKDPISANISANHPLVHISWERILCVSLLK